MVITYEIVKDVIEYVINNPDENDYVNFIISNYSFTEDRAYFWWDLFLNAICSSLGIEVSESSAKSWLINQVSNGVTLDQLCDKLIAMVSAIWNQEGEIIVIRNGQLYRKIQKYDVDLTQPPTGLHSVHFADINVGVINGKREVIVVINRWSYLISWDGLPDRFKQLYVLRLRLQNVQIPEDLQQYITNNIDVTNFYFEIDLDQATLLDEI